MKIEAATRLKATQESKPSFLPDRLVMIDCEMTGLQWDKDDIIQIAALKLQLEGDQYVVVGDPFELFLHTDLTPESEFAKKYMAEVYKKANKSPYGYAEAADMLKVFLGDWAGKVSPVGDCVPTDIMFLLQKGVIKSSYYDLVDGKDVAVPGTFFYEFFDINAIKSIARQKMGIKFDKELPRLPGDHDALVDCYNQLTELNAFLSALLD
jgi:oligoribonuclease (3'-5' exoribonuclease)